MKMDEYDVMIESFIKFYSDIVVDNPEAKGLFFVVDQRGFIKVHWENFYYEFVACVQLWDAKL